MAVRVFIKRLLTTKGEFMKRVFSTIALTSALFLADVGIAQDNLQRPDHFKGLDAPTLEVAVANLTSYNQKLKQRLAGEVGTEDMVAIHELTYTLENALETISNELQSIAELLEEVHVASETLDAKTAKSSGASYLQASEPLTQP